MVSSGMRLNRVSFREFALGRCVKSGKPRSQLGCDSPRDKTRLDRWC